jgi:uncharacterized BrkB/YihY/UPF0761 family membrane protein
MRRCWLGTVSYYQWKEGEVSLSSVTETPFASTATSRRTKPGAVGPLREIWARILKDDGAGLAAEMAYFFFFPLALLPFFALLDALAGFLPSNLWTNITHQIIEHFPAEAGDLALPTPLRTGHSSP